MTQSPGIQARTLYDQVRDEFVRRVMTREWKPGELLKSEADLARELGVSLGTLRKAFDCLTDMQLFVRLPGKGTVVVDQISLKPNHRFIHTRDEKGELVLGDLEVSDAHLVAAPLELAELFDVPQNSELIRFKRSRFYRGRVFTCETVHIAPVKDDPLPLDERAKNLWYDRDVTIDKTEWVDAELANERLAEAFQTTAGTPLFCSKRIIYGYRQKVLEHRSGHIHPGKDLKFVHRPAAPLGVIDGRNAYPGLPPPSWSIPSSLRYGGSSKGR